MREIRIYQPGAYTSGDVIELSPEASQHVGTVLRMRAGEHLTLFCGDNREFKATIQDVLKKKVLVSVNDVTIANRESPLAIHLAQAISKGDRMEWVMQKAVELGVTSITPLFTERCVVKLDEQRLSKKIKQWQAIAIAACEQCGRNFIPSIFPAKTFNQYLESIEVSTKFVLDPYQAMPWRHYKLSAQSSPLALLIGPEGGLSEAEVQLALTQGFKPLSLGPRILRTETAAISALSLLQGVAGDL